MASCLVLGANGFIGSHLTDALSAANHDVIAFDRFSGDTRFEHSDNIKQFHGNFLNKNDLRSALEGIDYVFHFISLTTPATAENDPLIDIETNIRMSIELLNLCAEMGVKRVLFASTGGAIYGEGAGKPFLETDCPQPISPYAIGKLTIEHYLRYFRIKHSLDSVSLRISNPYGERQPLHRKQGVIPVFLENIIKGNEITVLGNGEMVRDYIYVKDAVKMIVNMFDKEHNHEVYNIGSGNGTTVNHLVEVIQQFVAEPIVTINKPVPPTFVHSAVMNVDRYYEEFNGVEMSNFNVCIKNTLDYIKHELDASK